MYPSLGAESWSNLPRQTKPAEMGHFYGMLVTTYEHLGIAIPVPRLPCFPIPSNAIPFPMLHAYCWTRKLLPRPYQSIPQ